LAPIVESGTLADLLKGESLPLAQILQVIAITPLRVGLIAAHAYDA
jgi:hypothetical protein